MSGESDEHAALVVGLTEYVRERHGSRGNLALYLDDQMRDRERPQRISGHLPDLYAEDVPRTFVIIGEAKTRPDLLATRSRRQLASFVQYLSLYECAFFYLAVPLLAKPAATSLLRELGREHATVRTRILTLEVGF